MPYFHYVETITNQAGDALSGYFVRLKEGSDYADLYSDESGTAIETVSGVANAAKTNDRGRVSAYVADGYYTVEIYDKNDSDLLLDSVANVPMLSGTEAFTVCASAENADISVGTSLVTFRMPHAFILSTVRASVSTAPVGDDLLVDILLDGVSILTDPLTIDDGEKTSVTSASPAVIGTTSLTDDGEISIDVTQVGSTTPGTGLKVTLIGIRS